MYSVISVVESFTDVFIFWIPFYYEIKLALLLALQVPQLKLAATLYSTYIQPWLKQNENKIDSMVDEAKTAVKNKAKEVVTEKAPQIVSGLVAAQRLELQFTPDNTSLHLYLWTPTYKLVYFLYHY